MKKWLIITSLLSIIIIGFIPLTRSVNLTINAAYFNVYQHLSIAKNWLKWQPVLKLNANNRLLKTDSNKTGFEISAPGIAFVVERTGLNEFRVIKTENRKVSRFNYTLVPQAITNKTIVIVTRKTNLLGYVWSVATESDLKESPLHELKNYMENVRLYYGFTIQRQHAPEKLILVKKQTILKKNIYLQNTVAIDQLDDFVSKNDLKVLYLIHLQYLSLKNDSIQTMIGLPVNKKVAATGNLEFMNMPAGKILVGYFNGPYNNRQKLYKAMQLYMKDNYLHPIILPFETFVNNKLPVGDSAAVDMRVIMPYL